MHAEVALATGTKGIVRAAYGTQGTVAVMGRDHRPFSLPVPTGTLEAGRAHKGPDDAGGQMTTRGLDILPREECLRLLEQNSFGRIGLQIDDDPVVLPVYYALANDEIVFRTDPGTKLIAAVLGTRVAFEVDDRNEGWSVLVIGRAHEVRAPSPDLTVLQARLGDRWPEGERDRVVRIDMERVSGRRLRQK
jgi:nitroimidazol reductase NimA-like FMN-containing flavoprotein (pyridoxamine 5'-phosphate oxidase superfamily)